MDKISVNIRLRPVRFAFLVRPDDKSRLHRIFQINTCLWGGKFNPIIPFFKRVPQWWERQGMRFDNAAQIVNGYLDFFEPDFVVEAEKGIAGGLGFKPQRVLQLTDVLVRNNDRHERGYGLGVLDLYRQLYKEEYQFVRRHKHTFVSAKAKDSAFKTFVACLFGSFPTQQDFKYFEAAFKDAFDPEVAVVEASSIEKLYKSQKISALRVGHSNLEVDFHNFHDPTVFVLNAEEPKDLIDYWNYRAIYRDVMAIPVQWLAELSVVCKEFIVKNHRPLPGNPNGVMITPKVMFSRSIPEKEIEPFYVKHLKVDKPSSNALQTWYPPIWQPSPEFMVRTVRPTLEHQSKKHDVPVDLENPYIQFDTLSPAFAERFGNKCRWANVIGLQDWSHKDRLATVFPCDFKNPSMPKFGFGEEHLLSTTEGIVTFPQFKDGSELWRLTEGAEALNQWLSDHKIVSRLSESGRATQQIIQTLGGFLGVRNLAAKGVIELLEKMSRRPITRSAQRNEFQNKIKTAVGNHMWRHKVFESLVERKAVELGYELKCAKCGNWSWYRLSQLNTSMNCDLCQRTFEFPITDPSNHDHARWAYRVVGPFALPNYAKGGYASALTIRFFADVIGGRLESGTTWSAGQELTFPNGAKVEADLILWYQRKRHGTDYPTESVFGEAKSFGRDAFKEEDVERMRILAEKFPGSILVFATMKEADQLSKDEIRRIRKLAEWGREYDKDRRKSRAPVIMLTGTELFAAHDLDHEWNEKGGKHQQIIAPGLVHIDHLRTLADLTQHLYLDLPMFGTWWEQKWRKKRQRRLRPSP